MLTPEEVARVCAAVERDRAAQAKPETEGNAGLAALLARRADARRSR